MVWQRTTVPFDDKPPGCWNATMINRKTLWCLLLALTLFGGCSPSGDEEKEVDIDRLNDQLRSLPYAGFSPTASKEKSGVVTNDADRSCPGYNLYVTRSLCLAELLDHDGNRIQSWRDESCRIWQDFELLPDGTFLVLGQKKAKGGSTAADPFGNRAMLRFSWQGAKLEEILIPVHHEIHFTAGKPLITFLFDRRVIREVHTKVPVLDNRIATLSENGEILESISLFELLQNAPEFELQKVKASNISGAKLIDLFHANTAEWIAVEGDAPIYAPGNIMVTMRHQDAVAIVDWANKKVLWIWGQGELSGPHDATLLENGNVLIFDNGLGRDWSRVIEIDPLSNEIVWEYRDSDLKNFYTCTRGTSQRLPNGNTLITESNKGKVFEVLPSGEIVWQFHTPHQNKEGHRANIIRMRRYPESYIHNIAETVKADSLADRKNNYPFPPIPASRN